MYDKEVINVLLNLARRHLATTFTLYADYTANHDSNHELCLAMAALGGLFVDAECAMTVTKILYNDARRLHFENFHLRAFTSSYKAALDCMKTFILLALYGICSGDKRSYEFTEAFHVSMIQVMRYCCELASTEPNAAVSSRFSLVLEAWTIIQSYRPLILQRPPSFLSELPFLESQNSHKLDLLPLLCPNENTDKISGSLQEVSYLGALTWAASSEWNEQGHRWRLWRSELIGLALERWMAKYSESRRPSELSCTLIYHLSHLQLLVNITFLRTSTRDFMRSAKTVEDQNLHDALQNCLHGQQFEAAVWHATTMLRVIQENLALQDGIETDSVGTPPLLEPPHLPYCIYFSTIVVWYRKNTERDLHPVDSIVCIRQGVRLLGRLKMRVAKVLQRSLHELFPEEHHVDLC